MNLQPHVIRFAVALASTAAAGALALAGPAADAATPRIQAGVQQAQATTSPAVAYELGWQ